LNVGPACSLFRVRRHQRRVQVHDQRLARVRVVVRRVDPGQRRHPSPRRRAVLIPANAAGASAASAAIVRETVGSDATSPYRPGSPRSTATSARQSPPRARVTARSRTTLAGSCTANGLRHGASAADTAGPTPAAATVSVSSTPPA